MSRLKLILVLTIILALIPSCGPASSSEQDQLVETRVALGIAQTQLAQTETALSPQITQIPVGLTPLPSGTSVTVTVSLATNCRTGPSDIYPMVGGLQVGEVAEVVGKDAYDQYWIIILPSDPQVTCWLWGQYATVTGDTSQLAVIAAPPTPTAMVADVPPSGPGYTLNYIGMVSCGPSYAFRFSIVNNGSLTWESIRLVVVDNTTASTFTHQLDSFRSYSGCGVSTNDQGLEPGKTGTVSNILPGELGYNPTGHSITTTAKLCSQNGMAGTCQSKTVSFTP